MKQLTSELSGLQAQIRAEVLKVVDSLGNDAKIAADREAGSRRRVDEMKKTVVSSAPDTARLAQLEAQAKAKRTELERVQRQFEVAASTAGAAVTPTEVEIVSEAYPSNEKVFPKTGSMAGFVSFATFIVALLLSALREMARGARPAPAQAMALVAPHESARSSPAAERPEPRPAARTSDAATPLAAAQRLAALANGARGFRVLVSGQSATAAGAREASQLAQHLAVGATRVLLIGWPAWGDTLARLNGAASQPGTAEVLAGAASLEEAIQHVPDRGFDLLPAGLAAPKAVDGNSAAMVLDALDEMYDMIIVSAPPDTARELFEALQGRFDAGALLVPGAATLQPHNASSAFLGFNVPDLPVLTIAPFAEAPAGKRRDDIKPQARTARASLSAQ
jgi:polysaccharide biosynthesis transport protein